MRNERVGGDLMKIPLHAGTAASSLSAPAGTLLGFHWHRFSGDGKYRQNNKLIHPLPPRATYIYIPNLV